MSVTNSNSISVSFKNFCHGNPDAVKNEPDQAHIFRCTCCKNYQMRLQVMACCFERINHDTHLYFLF